MTAAALLTALRGVARLGGVSDAQLCQIASAAELVVHPALPAFPLHTPACALAALRACARSGGALPCREPPPAPLKRRRCGGSVVAYVQVAARAEAVSRCARRVQAAEASPCCDGAPAGAVGTPAGAVGAPAGAAGARACAELAPAGAVVASAGAVDSPAGAAAAPLGAVGAPLGAGDAGGRVVCRRVVGGMVPSGPVVGMWLLRVWVKGRWWMCGVCVWLVLMSLGMRGLLVRSWPCRVLLRTRPAVVRLRRAGVARVCVASGWVLRSGTCRPGCALVGAAFYTNGLGMALLSPSMCRSSRERRDRCLMGMDRYAILSILNL